jgi:signal transduction histidine kinase
MLPGSHVAPRIPTFPGPIEDPRALADAFSAFISASVTLECSYRDLQREVERLGSELAERNAALGNSRAENERTRATLQQMMDSLPCGVLVLNGCQDIMMINPAGRKLLNLGSASVHHVGDLAACSDIDPCAFAAKCDSDFETEVPITVGIDRRWLGVSEHEVNGTAVLDCSDRTSKDIRTVWILRDITAAKDAERDREEARTAVALAEISTILAHEIRNPLASMELFAGLVVDEPKRSGEWISNLRAGIRLLSGTVNNVLSMYSEAAPRLIPLRLTACVRSGVEFVRPIAEQAGVSLLFTAAAEELLIPGNEDAIRQILLNLICNAIRYTPAEGHIAISTELALGAEGPRARVLIADSGCGIAAEALQHLFEPGFSGNGSTPGLGLAVCRRLMTQHGGAITISSRVEAGTTFELEFPSL